MRTDRLDAEPVSSKRPGYLELNGTLQVDYADGSQCTMTCHAGGSMPVVVEIGCEALRCVSRESEGRAWIARPADEWAWKEVEARVPFQSEMTTHLVRELLDRGTCPLVDYDESSRIHLGLLEGLAPFSKHRPGAEGDDFPFT